MFSYEAPLAHRAGNRLRNTPTVRRYGYALVIPLTAILLATIMGVALGQVLDPRGDQPPPLKLHFRLLDLLDLESTPAPQKMGLLRIDQDGRVQVYIRAKPATPALLEQIETLGGKIDGQGLGVIQAWVPIMALESLAARPEVRYIYPPDYGHPNVGSVTTQGDTVLNVNTARQQFGVTGQGVRIGVISDGLKGLEASIASGDLPPTTFHCQARTIVLRANGCRPGETLVETSGGVTGKSFRSDEDVAAGAEGTAMLEIIHDLAPEAELWFAGPGLTTTVDFANAAIFLTANVDFVVSDLVFPGFFPDGQNTVAQGTTQIISNPSNRSRAFFQSAGNYADKHYSDLYTDSGFGDEFGNYHLFRATSETTGPSTPFYSNAILIPPFGSVTIFLSWNDPAGASTNDYDLLLVDCALEILLDLSVEFQNGFQEPSEAVFYQNPFSSELAVCYVIQKYQAAPRMLNVIIVSPSPHEFNTPQHSLTAPADAFGNLIAVGAVPASSPNQVEPFSSQGPTFDGRLKPELVATDGVAVTGAGGFPTPFFGTSASAPHAAAITALLLEANPSLTFEQIRTALTSTAIDLGTAGPDTVFGHGRIDALATVNALVGMPANTAPSVNAGVDQTITLPSTDTLDGTVTDDGLPSPPGVVTTTWSKVSGPGTVTFGNSSAVDTTASFSLPGTYLLRLTADDGALTNSAEVTIMVNPAPPVNQAPTVNAGSDQTITLPSGATLDGTVTDDGLPGGTAATTWSKVSGPGTVTFTNPNTIDTTATFNQAGIYVLRLTANDGLLQAFDDLVVTVNPTTLGEPTLYDLNGDGKADIVWRNTENGFVAVWLMDGLTLGPWGTPGGAPTTWVIAGIGDLNDDGKADLVWHNTSTGEVGGWLMDGFGPPIAGLIASAVPLDWKIVGVGDLNGDSKTDLVWRNTTTGDVAGWLLNGLSAPIMGMITAAVPLNWEIASVGDLNDDDKADLVWRETSTGTVGGWLMNGLAVSELGIFTESVPLEWIIAGMGDLDGDDKADIVYRNTNTGDVAASLMNGLDVKVGGSAIITSGVPLEWDIENVADLDGDGKADLVYRNTKTGNAPASLMNGLTVSESGIIASSVPLEWEIQR
jgi:hypothetical protein